MHAHTYTRSHISFELSWASSEFHLSIFNKLFIRTKMLTLREKLCVLVIFFLFSWNIKSIEYGVVYTSCDFPLFQLFSSCSFAFIHSWTSTVDAIYVLFIVLFIKWKRIWIYVDIESRQDDSPERVCFRK